MKNPRSAHREVWMIAFPMLLTGISTPLLGMVDTAVVGHLPDAHFLAAVALGSMIFTFLFWALGFLRMGTTGLTARAQGEKEQKNEEEWLILCRGIFLAVFIGFLLILCQVPIKSAVFYFIDTSADVYSYAQSYFDIRIWAAPATLATYVLLGWFLGLQKPNVNLLIVVTINLMNIFLDIIFVVYWDLAVAGVAWATVIAEYVGLALAMYCVVTMVKNDKIKTPHKSAQLVFQASAFKRYLVLNGDIFFRTLLLLICFSFFTLQSAKYGPVVLAANAILMNLQTLMAYALDSLAHAAEVLIGKSMGCDDPARLRETLKITGYWSLSIAVLFAIFYWLAGEQIIGLLTNIDTVKVMASVFLPWLILSPLISVWSYWLDGVFIGAGYSRAMRDTMFLSFIVFIVVWFVLQPLGNHGLWIALMSFMLARAISMAVVAKRKMQHLII